MKRRILLFITILWLVTAIITIQSTYAKYLTAFSSEGNINITAWNIVLNEQDVIENSNFSATLDLIIPETDYYIEDAIVPGSIGYFDLDIDVTNVITDVRYTLTCTSTQDNDIVDLKIIGYSLDLGTNITYLNSISSNITRVIAGRHSESIRIFVKWIDDNNQTLADYAQDLTDENDTSIAVNEGSAVIQANISFEQLN